MSELPQDMEGCCEHAQHEEEGSPAHAEEGDAIEGGGCDVVFDDGLDPKHHVMQREDDRDTDERCVDRVLHPNQKLGVLCGACAGKGYEQQPHVQGQQGYGGDALGEPVVFSCAVSVGEDEESCEAYDFAKHVRASSSSRARQAGARTARSYNPKRRRRANSARAPYPKRGVARHSACDRAGTK